MSKCKAVLDSEKIFSLKVKTTSVKKEVKKSENCKTRSN